MSKRRRSLWDEEDAFEFQGAGQHEMVEELSDMLEEDPVDGGQEFLDEAHEALSRLYSKTNKRARLIRGMRREDAWQ